MLKTKRCKLFSIPFSLFMDIMFFGGRAYERTELKIDAMTALLFVAIVVVMVGAYSLLKNVFGEE